MEETGARRATEDEDGYILVEASPEHHANHHRRIEELEAKVERMAAEHLAVESQLQDENARLRAALELIATDIRYLAACTIARAALEDANFDFRDPGER